jgi:hypothetical protein
MNMHVISPLTCSTTIDGAWARRFIVIMSRLVGPLAKSFSQSQAGQALGADAMAKRWDVLSITDDAWGIRQGFGTDQGDDRGQLGFLVGAVNSEQHDLETGLNSISIQDPDSGKAPRAIAEQGHDILARGDIRKGPESEVVLASGVTVKV